MRFLYCHMYICRSSEKKRQSWLLWKYWDRRTYKNKYIFSHFWCANIFLGWKICLPLIWPFIPQSFKCTFAAFTGFKTICLRKYQGLSLQWSERYSCYTRRLHKTNGSNTNTENISIHLFFSPVFLWPQLKNDVTSTCVLPYHEVAPGTKYELEGTISTNKTVIHDPLKNQCFL